jgi:hypothetical protein
MSLEKPPIPAEKPKNALLDFIEKNASMGSPRELMVRAIGEIAPWDLPENPEELKKVLSEAVDRAFSLSNIR